MTIRFDTGEFRRSHGKEPRGFGMWAFHLQGRPQHWPEMTFPPRSMSLTDAKAWMKREMRTNGLRSGYVSVLP